MLTAALIAAAMALSVASLLVGYLVGRIDRKRHDNALRRLEQAHGAIGANPRFTITKGNINGF